MKVKLGPIALVYNGTGTFVEKDEAAHRFVVEAKGKDKRGNGTAGATVTLTMADARPGGTDVEVLTDLAITGKPAQFGRGVMQDVSDKLLGQFVACLEQRLGEGLGSAPAKPPRPPRPRTVGHGGPQSVVTPPRRPPGRPTGPRPHDRPRAGRRPAAAKAPPASPPARADDAINLGTTVLPILIKSYWKQGLAGLVLIG